MTTKEKSRQERLKEKNKEKDAKLELEIDNLSVEIKGFNAALRKEGLPIQIKELLKEQREDSASQLERKENELRSVLTDLSYLDNDIDANSIASESNTIQKNSARIAIIAAVASWIGAVVALWPVLKRAVTGN